MSDNFFVSWCRYENYSLSLKTSLSFYVNTCTIALILAASRRDPMQNEPPDDNAHCFAWFYDQYRQLDERGRDFSQGIREQAVLLYRHNEKWIYGLYGILDGLSCSFTMLRFYFDARFANSSSSSSDMLHDWLLTPEGFACLIIESIVVVGLAFLGNTKNNPEWTKAAGTSWGFIRDGMKALKNGYRGVRNAIVFADMLALVQHLRYWLMPAGILLGAISMINRPWLSGKRKERDKARRSNTKLEKVIHEMRDKTYTGTKTWVELQVEIDERLKKQNQTCSFLLYMSATYNALLDAPNLYFGAVTLTIMAPALWIFVAVGVFSLTCIMTRIYEEYNGQRILLKNQTELMLERNLYEHELLLEQLEAMSPAQFENNDAFKQQQRPLIEALAKNKLEFEQYKAELKRLSTLSLGSRLLGALTNGMDAYAATSSIMFAVATICMFASIPFPPLLLAFWVVAGLACLVVPLIYESICYLYFPDLKQEFYKEWFEICRSFFAGGNKGLRSMDFILPSWENFGKDGHYHDTDNMMIFAWIMAAAYALSFSIRNVTKLEKTTKADKNKSGSALPFAWVLVVLYDIFIAPFITHTVQKSVDVDNTHVSAVGILPVSKNPVNVGTSRQGFFASVKQPPTMPDVACNTLTCAA